MITWHGLHSHCQICTRGCHLLWSAKQIFSFGKVPSFEVVHLQILHVVLHLHLDTVALIILATFELLVSIPGWLIKSKGCYDILRVPNLSNHFFASLSRVHLSLASQLS